MGEKMYIPWHHKENVHRNDLIFLFRCVFFLYHKELCLDENLMFRENKISAGDSSADLDWTLIVVVSSTTSRRYYNSTDNQFGSRNIWEMLVSGGHCFYSYILNPQNLNHSRCLKGRMRTYFTSLIEILDWDRNINRWNISHCERGLVPHLP